MVLLYKVTSNIDFGIIIYSNYNMLKGTSMDKRKNKITNTVTIITSVVSLLTAFNVNELLLPEPLSFIIPAIILIPCLVYLVNYLVNK